MVGEQKTILVVEDEEETAELFREMLEVSGYEVVSSSRTENAIEMIKTQAPNGIVLDIMLPDVSGLEVLNFVRQTPEFSQIPVVVVTAKALPSDVEAGLKAGATTYLTKPVSYFDLKRASRKGPLGNYQLDRVN